MCLLRLPHLKNVQLTLVKFVNDNRVITALKSKLLNHPYQFIFLSTITPHNFI
jgi:hypothetical protein